MADALPLQSQQPEQPSLPTRAFGPVEYADTQRQAAANALAVSPIDVSLNDVVGREQAGTFTLMGKNFEANADRRNKIFDHLAAIWGSREKP